MQQPLALVSPILPSYSETFIQLHLDRLPFDVHHFYSDPGRGFHPIYVEGKPLFSGQTWVHYLEAGVDRLFWERGMGFSLRKRAMVRYLKEHKIKVLLAEYGPVGGMITDVCKEAGVALITHFHGIDAYRHRTLKRFRWHYRQMFNYADAIIAVSQDMMVQLAALGASTEQLVLNPYSPNLSIFQYLPAVPKEEVIFLAVGRFTAKKAPQLTIKAFHQVWQAFPRTQLWMVGDGELFAACQVLVQELGIEEQVRFKGVCSPEQIADIHHKADVFVQHSVRASNGDSEGTPVAILEAMASGLPIVATRHAGIKDAVLEGDTGYLVDEHDVDGMAEHMLSLAQEPIQRTDMGRKGRERIDSYYTFEHHLARLEELILRYG